MNIIRKTLRGISIILLFLSASHSFAQFSHPGLPFDIEDLDRMKDNRMVSPWSTGYDLIANSSQASLSYTMQGPFVNVGREANDNLSEYANDGYAVLYQALQWYFTGNSTYATNAIAILDAWTTTHTTWSGSTPFLAASDDGLNYMMGAEILRYTYSGWTSTNTSNCETYFSNILWPLFDLPGSLRSANQGAAQLKGAIAVAVFCDDQDKLDVVLDAFVNDVCGGISNTLSNGQTGDTGRDVGHAMGMIKNLTYVSEVAWRQGFDLYGMLDNRLLTVHEYWCQFNLFEDVPWVDYGTCYGYYTSVSDSGRGAQSASTGTNELIYGAYAIRKGLSAPKVYSYRDTLSFNEESFLYRKSSSDVSTAYIDAPDSHPELPSAEVTSLIGSEVGSVGINGSESYSNGTWTVEGSGSNIWGPSTDSFHYSYKQVSGDTVMIARVESVENTHVVARAGIVLRDSLADDANMLVVYVRPESGGTEATWRGPNTAYALNQGYQTFGDAVEPKWVKIERRGSVVSGFVSPNGDSWTPIGNGTFTMSNDYYIGLGVCAYDNSTLNTSLFTDVQISDSSKNLALGGNATQSSTAYGAGASRAIDGNTSGIWSDSSVTHTSNETNAWWKVDLGSTDKIGDIVINNRTDCCRERLSDFTVSVLDGNGSVVFSEVIVDYPNPTLIVDAQGVEGSSVRIELNGTERLALAEVQVFEYEGAGGLNSQDIGSVSATGSISESNGTYTIEGSGADIWNSADEFRYAYQSLSGDGEIVARVVDVENTNTWAKGGVMIRESLDAGSACVTVIQRPDQQSSFQWRSSAGGSSSWNGSLQGGTSAAKYLRLTRSGDDFTAYYSTSSASGPWTQIGSTQTISMGSTVYCGLAVTSHDDGVLATATFDNVSISEVVYDPNVVGEWSFDSVSSSVVYDSGAYSNDGSRNGGTIVTGNTGDAMDFDGVDDDIDLPATAFSSISDEVTLSMWVNGDGSQPVSDTIFRAVDSSGYRVFNIHLPWSNSNVYWDAGNGGTSSYDRIQGAASLSDFEGQWNHWVFTKNANSGEMVIYLNGSVFQSGTGKTRSMSGITSATLGSANSSLNYSGTIDEVVLYDIALSASEVSALYNSY